MSPDDKTWQKLVAAARRAPPAADESAPFGFATRVVALAFDRSRPPQAAFGRMAFRSAAVACLIAVAAVAANYSAIRGAFDNDSTVAANDDPIAEVVDLGT